MSIFFFCQSDFNTNPKISWQKFNLYGRLNQHYASNITVLLCFSFEIIIFCRNRFKLQAYHPVIVFVFTSSCCFWCIEFKLFWKMFILNPIVHHWYKFVSVESKGSWTSRVFLRISYLSTKRLLQFIGSRQSFTLQSEQPRLTDLNLHLGQYLGCSGHVSRCETASTEKWKL